ncbi:PREDICTED: facilitated trehalose transporter Tret1-like [Vollenhovia emeryi]|uniref:facilitated trehalose transporter Tret1-like n=1 Tax=Vollenhovia emeryi TaxID=411798 RepID=UPI0005F3DCAD|nr:PREDICTED: facilitated trehalose transporter Tret1-like [Vollenhovia emeryi]XP_011862529.1 PREDICTED: facilitated trehalose transporter Tret1-like [Vollenhovia emeryi]XP_011862530.1 PREDICTED: facilitated trehalose transporter Tret1-like [Vollenhovia emeryi]XP_011862531.1 PREDICTED: facilitated trehalose transporter Tret1-like [Vollenhovia emeryi]XP_011862532.1 PREDICTED: facilitated trehalose transporter Tret1-like [Vollenhovia emeryi]
MTKVEEIAEVKTLTDAERDERLCNEVSNFLPRIADRSSKEKITMADVMPQIIASCIIHCITIKAGINMAYSTILLDGLESDAADMRVTESEGSWIASLVTITLPVGSLIAGPLMDKFGRKVVCLLSCVPAAISWTSLIFASSLVTIYAARAVAGIAAGLTTVGLVYISELAHPQVRPMLLCLNSVFVSLGILIPCCLAVMLDWRKMAIIFLALECCIFLILYLVPESPYWLVCFPSGMFNEERICRMKRSLRRLNRRQAIYEEEYSRIMETCGRKNAASDEAAKSVLVSLKNYYHVFTSPAACKPLLILFLLLLLQQLSGSYVVIFYAISVFREMGGTFGTSLNEHGALVMLGIIRFIMSIITVFCSRRYGRRVLCILSGIGMAISMLLSGMYLHFAVRYDENDNTEETVAGQKWLLLFFVLSYICTSSLGFTVIPWTLIGELLPVSVRGIGGGLLVSLAYIMMFAVIKSYPYVVKSMSIEGIFFFFSFSSLAGTAFVYFFLPETLGKSLSDIERFFSSAGGGRTRDVNSRNP